MTDTMKSSIRKTRMIHSHVMHRCITYHSTTVSTLNQAEGNHRLLCLCNYSANIETVFHIKATKPEVLSRVLVCNAQYPSKLGKNCHIQMRRASSFLWLVNLIFQKKTRERRMHN